MKYIVVGGVAGGASFACRLRRLDEKAEIVVYEKSGYVSYANCGLPYYLSGTIEDRRSLAVQTPQGLKDRFRIKAYVNAEVLSIDPASHTVKVRNLKSGALFQDDYDRLILSPGGRAIKIVPDSARVFELKNVEDALRMRSLIETSSPESAVIVGGGFIGLEAAENLAEAGLKVTVVEGRDHVLANLDSDIAAFVHEELRSHGVKLLLGTKVENIIDNGSKVVVQTDGGAFVADMLIQAIGVRPDSSLAESCGLSLGERGTIAVDECFKTSAEDIYAIGDAIALDSFVDGKRVNIALAGLANKEGRALADWFVLGQKPEIKAQGTSILKVFGLAAASVGFTESRLKAEGIRFEKIYAAPFDHASYYPGSDLMTLKLMYDPEDGKIYGAQIVGKQGVDKRIDVLATAMRLGMKAWDLKYLELSYAPPFSSAKDPVNMAGYMAENLRNGLVRQFYPEDVSAAVSDPGVQLVDVRTPQEYAAGHIENSINIPVDSMRELMGTLPKGKEIRLICQSAVRSYIAYRILTQNGFSCRHLAGGYRLYSTILKDRSN